MQCTLKLSMSIVLATAVACGTDAGTDDVAEIEAALAQDFGALEATDEEPTFGDATFDDLGETGEDPAELPPADDSIGNDANDATDTATGAAQDPTIPVVDRPVVYAIAVAWGRHVVDTTADGATLWNPTVSTDCGVLAVKRLVKMEGPEGVVRPRTSAQAVSFRSGTGSAFDGAIVVLAIPQSQIACTETGMLRFQSDALSAPLEVPLDDSMANLVLRHSLGDGNNVVAYGHQIEPSQNDACVRGHIGGRWVSAINASGEVRANTGRFYGRVIGQLGELRGHIKGIYGVPQAGRFEGKKVFFGKYINADGQFRGILAGRYGAGKMGGGWHVRPVGDPSALRGLALGQYASTPNLVPDGGLFHMRYAALECLRTPSTDPLE